MKIAIISDIHGNDEALTAVLNDIESQKCDKIYCLGDLAMAGPEPSYVLNKIKNLVTNGKIVTIQGNTDKMLSLYNQEIYDKLKKTVPVMANAYSADSCELSDVDKAFLSSLPEKITVEINGVKIMFCHGSPVKNDDNITSDIPLDRLENMIKDADAEVIFCGHTHVPCGFATNSKKTVVNAGSVGRPFSEEPKSCYAIMDIQDNSDYSIEHRIIKYDFEAAARKLEKRNFEGSEKLASMLRKATSRYPQ